MRVGRRIGLATLSAVLATTGAIIGSRTAGAVDAPGINNVEHVVVLMQENRSTDHYLGLLNKQGQPDFESEPNTGNPDPTDPSSPILPFHTHRLCEVADLDHSWNATHIAYDNGAMDGFTKININPLDPSGSRAMGYYTKADLPFYNDLYKTFATGDRYFSSALTQTFPNRFFLLAATSFGHIRNDIPPPGGFDQKTIFELLDDAGVSWKLYFNQIAFGVIFKYVQDHPGHVFPISQYYADLSAGALPQVSFVDPIFAADRNTENDEHPPANVQVGQKFTADVVNALMTSDSWGTSALFLTYDEHGGFYDHVAPPAAPLPDNIPPILEPGDQPGAFDRYGIRVPAVVVSPFSKKRFVSHVVNDHTSILAFIERRFGLPALTNRDANANPMLEFFDFARKPFATPPTLAEATIDPARFAECAAPPPQFPIFRVNAGGPPISDEGGKWREDSLAHPSPFVNVTPTTNTVFHTDSPIDISADPRLPHRMFQDERWRGGAPSLTYAVPVGNGNYQVRLHFAETYLPVAHPGGRLFNVSIEGEQVLTNFDQFVAAGNQANKAVVRSFNTSVADGQMDIRFRSVVQNPAIKGIEIIPA